MILNTSFDSAFHFLLMIIPVSLLHKSRSCKSIAMIDYKQLITIKLTFSSLWTSSPASPPSSVIKRSDLLAPRFRLVSVRYCQIIMHHPLISWVSIVACMEAVKFSSTWTLSFSFHPLYWVVWWRRGLQRMRRWRGRRNSWK